MNCAGINCAGLPEVERHQKNGGHRCKDRSDEVEEADVVVHDSRNREECTDGAYHDARDFRVQPAHNRLRRFARGICRKEVRRDGREHYDNDARDAETRKENRLRDVVAHTGACDFKPDEIHPETGDGVSDGRNRRSAHRLFHILRVVRNHGQPRERQGQRYFKDVPETEDVGSCGIRTRRGCPSRNRARYEQLNSQGGKQDGEHRHHDGSDLREATQTHENPECDKHRKQHAGQRERNRKVQAREHGGALRVQDRNPRHQLEKVQRRKEFGAVCPVDRGCCFHRVHPDAGADKSHEEQENSADDMPENQRQPQGTRSSLGTDFYTRLNFGNGNCDSKPDDGIRKQACTFFHSTPALFFFERKYRTPVSERPILFIWREL